MAGLIYTADFGGYDKPRPNPRESCKVAAQYMRYADCGPVDGWEHMPYPRIPPGLRRTMNRIIKMTPHLQFPWQLYIDGSMHPRPALDHLLKRATLSGWDAILFIHPERNNADDEFEFCKKVGKIGIEEAPNYRKAPGLFCGGFIWTRRRSNLLSYWRHHYVKAGHERDQFTLPAAVQDARKAGEKIHVLRENIWDNEFFEFRRHGV